MKELIIYFGKQNDGVLGLGSTADKIKCNAPDDFDVNSFLESKWVSVNIQNGTKYINTDNILWFDIVEKKEDKTDKE